VDGPIELGFHAWDLDHFGDREVLPFHVRLCIEGIPHHAWSKGIADVVLRDEAMIHHVEEEVMDRLDQWVFKCWVLIKDQSRILQTVFLIMPQYEQEPRRNDLVHFNQPRAAKQCHVFNILIHIDDVEDLMFYHFP
jgi:hypothetical protein